MATYYEDYAPKDANKFAEMYNDFQRCKTKEMLAAHATIYTFDRSYDREDILVALGRVEREKGWKV